MWENCHDYDPEVEKQVGKPARTALTNEQKAKRLEQMAAVCIGTPTHALPMPPAPEGTDA